MTQDFKERYAAARRRVIARRYDRLNPPQREAVLSTEGPLLLLAGAGSGKTTVLINRVDNLLTFGRGSDTDFVPEEADGEALAFLENFPRAPAEEDWRKARQLCAVDPALPWTVLAITFTNKAAGELRERLTRSCGSGANDVWAATFHSACVRILRRDIQRLNLGFNGSFTIYDTDDSRRCLKEVLREMRLEEKEFQPRYVLTVISNAKDKDLSPEEFAAGAGKSFDWRMPRIAEIYRNYVKKLREANALDFDDIILYTVHLLQEDEETRRYYQNKFRYVLIDEYQDTNLLQYRLARLLAGGRGNLCVVGDDDQSIYRFRGADIENILSFERQHPGCRTIRLEQNYRSTGHILAAANALIKNNAGRKGKTLWTESGAGEKVRVRTVFNETEEAGFVADQILESRSRGEAWRDSAVLYRTNAQSNALEMALKRCGVPYKVYGGMKFFDRAEVKDMLSYLAVLNNPADDLRLRRIVNVPVRGIGDTTMDRVQAMAALDGVSLWEELCEADNRPEIKGAAAGKIRGFVEMMNALRQEEKTLPLPEFYDLVCEKTGYIRALEEKKDRESQGRIENVRELRSSIVSFLEAGPDNPTLAGFLDSVALYTDLDDANAGDDFVSLMTMHSAKGLEFPTVYAVGMEEGLFPGTRSFNDAEELEEERRLCYVAMTRARERLVMTNARQRMLYGKTNASLPSRFLEELPEEAVVWEGKEPEAPADDFSRFGGSAFSRPAGSGTTQGGRLPWEDGEHERREAPRSAVAARTGRGLSAGAGLTAKEGAGPLMQLAAGDTVRHKTFGEGRVLSVKPMAGDALVEVDFPGGRKKLMLKFAGPHMEKV